MEKVVIVGTEDTPGIILDKENGLISIYGRSLPEDVTVFYQPVFDWLNLLKGSKFTELTMEVKLEYFNTASSKILLDIFMALEEMFDGEESQAKVKWHYDKSDEDMLEAGEEYKEIVAIEFEMIGY
ncbi:MAG: DUF1987 domain-containing protein [Bacteroidota bacterium]|nr:DUF1987 domain-containing protein [Bacteroidota bacterium]